MTKKITKVETGSVDFVIKELHDNEDGYNIEAIATNFNEPDLIGDVMLPKCLDKYIKEFNEGTAPPLRMLKMHNREIIIGEWKSIKVQGDQVIVKGNVFMDIQDGKETMMLIKKGLLPGVSMGFEAIEFEANDEDFTRVFKEIYLMETSVVDIPANQAALITNTKSIKAIERILKHSGYSNRQAKSFISSGKKSLEKTDKQILISKLKKIKL